jgi:pyridoxamine 5'-phosphate oxidase
MPHDPIARFHRWFNAARRAGLAQPDAMALATADASGRPSVRFVLLKSADQRGFVFFTNGYSRKGQELRDNPRAALAIHWLPLGKQVRVEGAVEGVPAEEVDAYWRTRPRESQLGALASQQSAELSSRRHLVAGWKRLLRVYDGKHVPRPPAWTGFRIVPEAIEFWTHGDHRLHHRELFTRTRTGWQRTLLQP